MKTKDESIFQAYLASVPHHPILRLAIEKMMEIGPRVGVSPPETMPFWKIIRLSVCTAIETLLGTEVKTGSGIHHMVRPQLASERTKRSRSILRFLLPKGPHMFTMVTRR